MIAAKSGAACDVQLLKEPGHRAARSQGTLRFILPDNKFAENPSGGQAAFRSSQPQVRVWDFVTQNPTIKVLFTSPGVLRECDRISGWPVAGYGWLGATPHSLAWQDTVAPGASPTWIG